MVGSPSATHKHRAGSAGSGGGGIMARKNNLKRQKAQHQALVEREVELERKRALKTKKVREVCGVCGQLRGCPRSMRISESKLHSLPLNKS